MAVHHHNRQGIVALVSGGLDSVGMLVKLLQTEEGPIHVHHVKWLNEEDRADAETQAMQKIIPYCQTRYGWFECSESALDFRSLFLIADYQVLAFVAYMLAMTYHSGCSRIALGWLATDDHAKRARQVALFNRLKVEGGDPQVELVYPVVSLTKAHLLRNLPPELIRMTWSCRTPVRHEGQFLQCGKCITCAALEKAYL